ncbi:hypothetical protein AB0K34_23550 [Actinomadura sp. NPDC049382]|uniref:ComEC/Rec2 family competence protein n=1 Tax=Actinomadura sp. NPDC049382 TaxID=3158220 RepID=UPI00343CEAB9
MPTQAKVDAAEQTILEVIILDVGHGNSAVAYDGHARLVVDVAQEVTLFEELEQSRSSLIDHLVLSHSDADHIRGASAALSRREISVANLWVNPDGTKDSETFVDLMYLAQDLFESTGLAVHTNLNVGAKAALTSGRVEVEILHPGIAFALSGPGRRKRGPQGISSNSMSAVLRIRLAGHPAVLLPGDLDLTGFESLVANGTDMSAPVLVFPHHGGRTGSGGDREFARMICEAVGPELVIFSHGRRKFNNPRPEIVEGIREARPDVRIICTQVSRSCQAEEIPLGNHHLLNRPALGRRENLCCGGSVVVSLSGEGINWRPASAGHGTFVQGLSTPLCRVTFGDLTK